MRRLHLFEWEDFSWFPAAWRDAGTSFLELMVRVSGHARMLAPKIEEVVRATGTTRLVALCAGGGGPLPIVVKELRAKGLAVTAMQTDLFPNLPAFERIEKASEGAITHAPEPVDACAVPAALPGVRVVFNALHHLRPRDAKRVLADAAQRAQPIAVFEVVSREALPLFGMFLSPLNFLLALPFLRPFRWSWVPFTYLVPVLPAFILWDGLVSWLRIYSEPELRELCEGIEAPPGWIWDIGRIRLGNAPAHATYLVGRPATTG